MSGRKRVTVERAFERWWKNNGGNYATDDTRLYARAAWCNGYVLGQRREKAKHARRKPGS